MPISKNFATNPICKRSTVSISLQRQALKWSILSSCNRHTNRHRRPSCPTRTSRKSFEPNADTSRTGRVLLPSCSYDFKGIIDYIFYSTQLMRVLGVLGPLDPEWLQSNRIVGCPNPNVPSDHFSLLAEFELHPSSPKPSGNGINTSQSSAAPFSTQQQ